MSLVFGIFTVIGGVAYLLYQCHNESPGFLTCAIVFMLMVCSPILLVNGAAAISPTLGIIVGIVVIIGIIIGGCYMIFGGSEKMMRDSVNESAEIWAEVARLPLPDEQTLSQIKIANHIPLVPKCQSYDNAALDAWRRDEYNKRFKEKHKLVWYAK